MTSTFWGPSRGRSPADSPQAGRTSALQHRRGRRSSPSPRKRVRRPAAPAALREAGLSPRKALAQHFLTSTSILQRIADAVDISPDENVIEVGAGLGGLTAELATRTGRLVAIELDENLVNYLRRRFQRENVVVVQGDALALSPSEALFPAGASKPYVVVGNLPYSIAQPLLRHFLEAQPPPQRLVVMVQAEVAESIVAEPGKMSLLSVSVQLYGEPRLLFRVPPTAFYPSPKVRSAVVRIDVAPRPRVDVDDTEMFFRVVRAGFSARRKQLRNALARGLRIAPPKAADLLAAAGIDSTLRAQALPLEGWAALTRVWTEAGRPEGQQ